MKTSKLELRLPLETCIVSVSCLLSSTVDVLRKSLPIASQAWGSELIMHNIENSARVSDCEGIQRVFSFEEEESGAGVTFLQLTRGPTKLHLNVLGRVVSFPVLRIGIQQVLL